MISAGATSKRSNDIADAIERTRRHALVDYFRSFGPSDARELRAQQVVQASVAEAPTGVGILDDPACQRASRCIRLVRIANSTAPVRPLCHYAYHLCASGAFWNKYASSAIRTDCAFISVQTAR